MKPRLTGAGATTAPKRSQAVRRSVLTALSVSPPGMPRVVVWGSITQATYSSRPTPEMAAATTGLRPRRRTTLATRWLTRAAPTTGGRKEPSANSRVSDAMAATVTRANESSARAGVTLPADSRREPAAGGEAGAATGGADDDVDIDGSCSSVLIGEPRGGGRVRRRTTSRPRRRRRTG